ncbi:MAG: type I restriction enzyme HsdR N-terminal domain-containing protein [Bacteroidales bacterium]|nr:type I restriction enzyme HsdR N-terminal domain-containing protein [Bacteroidales bacterium]
MGGLHWFKTKQNKGKTEVFDPVRKRYVALTPEEEVRQMVLHHFIEKLGMPPGLVAVEYSIKLHRLEKRCDIVVFSPQAAPLLIVECKARNVELSQAVLDQVIRYNMSLNAPYLLITNGINQYSIRIQASTENIEFLDYIPNYAQLTAS